MPINATGRTQIIKWTNSNTVPAVVDGVVASMDAMGSEIRYEIKFTPPHNGTLLTYALATGHHTDQDCGASLRLKVQEVELIRLNDGSESPPGPGKWPSRKNFTDYYLRCSPKPDAYPGDDGYFAKKVEANAEVLIEIYFWNHHATTAGFNIDAIYIPD